MKEQLENVKLMAKEAVEAKNNFTKQRIFFNLKVEEAKEQMKIEEFFGLEFTDSYEAANYFYEECENITEVVRKIKKKHPKYGNARVKAEAIKKFPELCDGYDEIEFNDIEVIDGLIDNYFLYESCGYLKVKIAETYVEYHESELSKSVESLLQEPQKAFETVKTTTKDILRRGNKRLIKLHQDIEKKLK